MSSTFEILTTLQNTALAHAIAKSDHLVGATAQVFHILGFIFLLAAVVFINLRLAGVVLGNQSIPSLSRQPKLLIWGGLVSAVVSGILMFISAPTLYFYNPAFIAKIWILVAAIFLQFTIYRHVTNQEKPSPALAKVSIVLSVVLWFGVGLTGRAIGFV
ncbi:DUF6644 family protein [Azonexus sp. R2A61]|uniref:DUF6644 family protein n=1 Tax=Azonexus sp. R2A61 TaxID=2744443 RepID=UPI001F413DAA|nr:DUF6644 family protein [Azonexus sp. R2A61]